MTLELIGAVSLKGKGKNHWRGDKEGFGIAGDILFHGVSSGSRKKFTLWTFIELYNDVLLTH